MELNRYVLIDMNGEVQKSISNNYKYSKKTSSTFIALYDNISFKSNDMLHFKYWLNDTVFTLTGENKVVPYMIFNSHGKQPTVDALANDTRGIFRNYLNIYSIFETSRYLFYRYINGSTCVRVFDKISKKTFYIDYISREKTKWLTDDIVGGVNIEPKFCVNDKLYSWVDALILKNYIKSEEFKNSVVKNPDQKVALQRLAETIDESDNPVLIIVTPKK